MDLLHDIRNLLDPKRHCEVRMAFMTDVAERIQADAWICSLGKYCDSDCKHVFFVGVSKVNISEKEFIALIRAEEHKKCHEAVRRLFRLSSNMGVCATNEDDLVDSELRAWRHLRIASMIKSVFHLRDDIFSAINFFRMDGKERFS